MIMGVAVSSTITLLFHEAMNLISPLITRDVTAGSFLKNFVRGGTESYGQRNAWRSMCSVWDYQGNRSKRLFS